MQVAPSASTYAPASGDLVSQTPAGSAHLFADPYQAPQQDPTGAFADSSPGSFGDTGSQDQPDPPYLRADTALASTSLFASTGITSSTLAQMVQAQTKPLLVTAENAAGLGIDLAPTKPLTVTPENAAGLNLPPQTGSAAPASATAPATPTASPTEIAALELLLAEPANQEIIAQFGPPLRPLNTDTDVGQGILARFGPDLGARLTQLQEAHNAVRDEFLQALDQAQQNPGPDVAGSALIAQHTSGGDAQHIIEQTLHSVTHPPSASQASDLQAIEAQTLAAGGQQQNLWRLSDPAEFAKAYAAGDSPAQKAFAQLHGKEPLQFNAAVQHGETDAGPQITPAYYSLGENHLVLGDPTATENGNPGPWAASTWQAPQLSPEQNRDLINNEYLWFDPVNGWSTDLANNIRQSTSLLDKALPMVFAGVMTFATAGVFGITAASASASLGQSMALGAIGSATMQLTTGGKIDLGDLLRSALTAGVTFGVTNLTGLGTALQSADLATRSLGHLGKAGLQGLLQEATGGQFKDGLTNSLLASVAGEVGKSLDSHIAALSENGELSVQEASMLKLLSRAASSAVKVVGSSDPAAGFASDFLGEVLGEELRGAQAKAPSQSQAPSQNTGQNPSQTANGAGDRPSSDWVRNLGPSEVDAQGLWPGPAGQGLQISGDALSHWSGEIDGGIALNGSMAPGAQAITEAVVGQGQGPLAALAAAGLDKHQQIAAYGQLVASGQIQLNAQGVPIVQPGLVLQFDLSDMSAAQLGGRAIAQESAGRAQRQALEELAAQQAAQTYAGGAGGGRGFVNPALAGSLAGTAQDNGLFSRDSMNAYWSGDGILSRGMRAAGNTIYDAAEALTPADSTPQEVQRARELGQLRQSFNAAREAGDIGEMQKLQARHAQITSADGNPSMLQVSMASDILRAQIEQGLPADRYSLGLAAGAAITQGFAGMVAPTAGGPIAGAKGGAAAIKNGGTVELFTDAAGPKIPGAVGVGPTDPRAVATNAMSMPNIPTGSQATVVASNPYIPKSAGGTFSMMDYLPEASRITKAGGEIVINGNAPNKYFSNMPTATELDAMGLTIKYQGPLLPEYKGMSFTTTQGKPIDIETMQSIVFVKKTGKP